MCRRGDLAELVASSGPMSRLVLGSGSLLPSTLAVRRRTVRGAKGTSHRASEEGRMADLEDDILPAETGKGH